MDSTRPYPTTLTQLVSLVSFTFSGALWHQASGSGEFFFARIRSQIYQFEGELEFTERILSRICVGMKSQG